MKILKILVLFLIISSCKNASINNKQLNVNSDVGNESGRAIDQNLNMIEVDTNFHLSRQETPYNGRLLLKAQWDEKTGKNRFILSTQDTNYADGIGKYELFAYKYTKKEDKWEINWQMNDFVKGMGCDLKIDVLQTEIVDINKDGFAECILIYTLDNRCDASCLPTKLLLYSNGKKLAIRGLSQQYLLPPLPREKLLSNELFKGRDSINYKKIDTIAFKVNPTIVNYASTKWDSIIESENKEYFDNNKR